MVIWRISGDRRNGDNLNKIRKSKVFNRLLGILGTMGLDVLCIRIRYKWLEKHPTEEMKMSRSYFRKHSRDIERIENLLADNKSKRVWRRMIQFRATMNYRYHPGMENDQYFIRGGIMRLSGKEVFIDCGGYDGQTSLDFIERVNNTFRKIVVFEPDPKCLSMISEKVPHDNRIKVIPKGVWDAETSIGFVSSGDQASHIVKKENGAQGIDNITVIPIDNCEECRDATFIKMDLEGAEQNALRGAEKTIRRNMPKLAISIYHSDQDMIEIIDYIHKLVPEYKLYVRHHSRGWIDTVLYAVF